MFRLRKPPGDAPGSADYSASHIQACEKRAWKSGEEMMPCSESRLSELMADTRLRVRVLTIRRS